MIVSTLQSAPARIKYTAVLSPLARVGASGGTTLA
jgi:hypothetical protein